MKIKKSFTYLSLLLLSCSLIVTALTTSIVTFAMSLSDTSTSDADFYVDLDNDGNQDLGCYITTAATQDTNGKVAIAWAGDKESTEDVRLDLTKKSLLENDNHQYEVTGVAYGGFRYTLFKEIRLPNTIVELGKECFAYCLNLESFMLPTNVGVIPASAFLDCRDLETFTYFTGVVHHIYLYDNENTKWNEISSLTFGEGAPNGETDTSKLYLDTESITVYKYSNGNWDNGTAVSLSGEESPNHRTDIVNPSGYYYRIEYRDSIINDIESFSIEDHAFDSCVSLMSFNFPNNLSYIGESAFQRCRNITKLYFPTNNNNLTIGAYAFCDCSLLSWAYFEQNLKDVGNYAFSNCNENLIFHYGKKENSSVTKSTIDTKFITTQTGLESASWRNKYLSTSKTSETDKIDFEINMIVHFRASDHPEMVFSIESGNINLNCQRGDGTPICLDNSGGSYLTLQQWTPPKYSTPGYYDIETGELTIQSPVTVGESELIVKAIGEEAFKDQTCLTKVKFSDGLVQICKKAFYRCNNIYSVDFSDVTTLKEISNSIFNDCLSGTVNADDKAISLNIPPSVEYIGSYAFYGFTKVKNLNLNYEDSHLKVLGGYSFGRIGESYGEGVIDVILPCTLDDSAAVLAQINDEIVFTKDLRDFNVENWAAIGPYSFGCGLLEGTETGIKSITIADCDHPHVPLGGGEPSTFSTSLAPNAFARSTYLTRFMSNDNLCYIGTDSFSKCPNLKEIFLTTARAEASGVNYPWGIRNVGEACDKNGLFRGAPKDLVIYLDNSGLTNKRAPGDMDSQPWYTESDNSYAHQLNSNFGRSQIPVVDNVAFGESKTAVLYWVPSSTGGSFMSESPKNTSQYNGENGSGCENGIVVLAQTGEYGNNHYKEYTVVKYFYDPSKDAPISEIDLTNINTTDTYSVEEEGVTVNKSYWVSTNHIVKIGEEAFANDNNKHRGLYFVLPDTIQTVAERAFYRNGAPNTSGVRIVTNVKGTDYTNAKNSFVGNNPTNDGYCNLPSSLTRIERNAFYGNYFKSVTINSSLSFLGKSAFYTHRTSPYSQLSTVSVSTSTLFDDSGNGIYYIGSGKKALLYQAQKISGTLDLSSDTNLKAIGMHAVASTSYSTIKIPTSLTNIYGGGFQNNASLTEVTIPSGSLLTHISAYSVDDGYWDSSLPFDIIDYSNKSSEVDRYKNSQGSAFNNCGNLKTFNFKNLTKLKKIGNSAFYNCKLLDNMVGGTGNYKYYKNGTSISETPADAKGILDLSHLNGTNNNEQLLSIGAGAFNECNAIKYIHLPASSGNIYIAGNAGVSDSSGQIISNNKKINILVGDKAFDSCPIASGIDGMDLVNVRKHYNTKCFGDGNYIYYYAESDNDVLAGSNTSLMYWTKYGVNDGYVLLDSRQNALDYLPSN